MERSGTIDTCGWRIAHRHRPGAPGRVPLLLCNGIGSSMEVLDPLVAELSTNRPVIRFDVPGVGYSRGSRLPFLYHGLAIATRRLLIHLGYRGQADVFGFSWGGGLAQQIAFQQPRRCRRVVLAATGTGMHMVPARPRTLLRMLSPRRHRDPEYARGIAGDIYGGTARHDPDGAVRALHRADRTTTTRAYLHQLAALGCWTSLPWLPMIRQPTLVLAGDDDPIIPSINGSIMSHLLPRGELHRYEGGHLAVLTESARLAPVIEEFLDR